MGRFGSLLFVASALTLLAVALVAPLGAPAVTLLDGDILVTDAGEVFGGTSRVIRIDPHTGAQQSVSVGGFLEAPGGIAVERNGTLVVADGGALIGSTTEVIRIEPSTGAQTLISSGGFLQFLSSLALDKTGAIYVGDSAGVFGGVSKIVRVNPDDGTQTLIASGGFLEDPGGFLVEEDGSVLVADLTRVIRIAPDGSQTLVSSGGFFANASDLAREQTGALLVIDADAFGGNGGLIRLSPGSPVQEMVTSGGFLRSPFGIDLDANGNALVTNPDLDEVSGLRGPGSVILINVDNGFQDELSFGNLLQVPIGITIVPEPARPALWMGALATLVLLRAHRVTEH